MTVNFMTFSSFRQAREPPIQTNPSGPEWINGRWAMPVRADHLPIHTGLHPYAFLYLSLSLFVMATGG